VPQEGSFKTPVELAWKLRERALAAGLALWIADRLHPFGQDAGSVVPEGFEGYVRPFHPVEVGGGRLARWSEIATRNGRLVHPEMQLHMISRPLGAPAPDQYDPGPGYNPGSLPRVQRGVLVEHLRRATATPDDCLFCVWEGFGGLNPQGVQQRVDLPGRSYLLARGPIEDAVPSVLDEPWDQSPNLWWPEDRAWIIAIEIDYAWTYVGGASSLIDGLLEDQRLEALPALLSHRPFHDSDLLNAALDR
jgi:hypothetical protein